MRVSVDSAILERLGEMFEAIFERAPGAGDVEALEAAARLAEDVAGVEPEVGVVDDDVVELLVRETVGREVKPEKISTFGLNQRDLGHPFGEERFRLLVVALDVGQELLEPVGAVLIGGLGGEEAARVGLAVAGRRDLGAEALARLYAAAPRAS